MFPDPDVDDSCAIGQLRCGGACVNPNVSTQHCGGCGMACEPDQFCALGECVDRCEDPLELCDEACVDLQTDPLNCGGCGNECASGICVMGECADTVVGHVVVIGHDYTQAVPAMQSIAGSALFLAAGSPVRAAVYAGGATNASRTGVTAASDEVIRLEGRSWQRVEVDADTLTAELLSVQAVIVHAQGRESDARLLELGTEWGKALAQFVARGGVIVVFEAPGSNAGTFQVLAPSGLFEAAGRETIANNLRLVIAQDQVGLGVARHATTRYESRRSTMRFQGVTSPAGVVVTDPDGLPVVLHRRVAPP
jgi:hypothetical protein